MDVLLWVLVTVLIMAIFKCLTRMLKMFMVKVTLEGRGLLDISSTNNLVHHFQSLYGATDLYGLKCWRITKYDVAISNNVREVWKRYQVNTSIQRPLFCSSSLFYITQSFHLVVTGTQIPYMQLLKMDLSLTIQCRVSTA